MRRLALLAVATLSLVASACSSPGPRPAVDTPVPEVPFVTAPPRTTPAHLDPTLTPPGPPLPEPVTIPADSYAPEPVIELGTIEIPALGLRNRIFQGVTLHNIDRGPSHWTGSALPGQMGNTVFAGHRATNDQPFRRIDALVAGDEVVFTVDGVRSTYRVTGHLIVDPSDTWIADQTHAYTGTLYTCHPVGSMAQRYVVQMELAGG